MQLPMVVLISLLACGFLFGGLLWIRAKGWLPILKHPMGAVATTIGVFSFVVAVKTMQEAGASLLESSICVGLALYTIGCAGLTPTRSTLNRLFAPQYFVVGFRPRSSKEKSWQKLNYYTRCGWSGFFRKFREGKHGPDSIDVETFERMVASGDIFRLSPECRMSETQSLFLKPNGEVVLADRSHPTEHRSRVVFRLPNQQKPKEHPLVTPA